MSAASSSSSSSIAGSTGTATSGTWQERIAGGRITTAPPAFSKDGDFLITCAATLLKVYSVKTGEVVKTLRHKSRVTGFFFNPANALQLYSVSYEGIIRLWDFEDGVLLKSWKIGGEGKINQAVLDAHHHVAYLSATKTDGDKKTSFISSFNLKNHTSRVRYSSNRPIGQLYVSPRGDYFAALFPDKRGFHLFDTNSVMHAIKHSHQITSFGFHPTESCVAYGDTTGVVRVNYCLPKPSESDDTHMMDATTEPQPKGAQWEQSRIDKYEWHTSPVSALHFSLDGYYLISGAREEVLVLWRLNSNNRIFIPRFGAAITSVTMNEQGTVYAVCCGDNSIRIIDARSRDMILKIQGISLDLTTMPISIEPRNGLIVTPFGQGNLQFYDAVNDKHVSQMEIVQNPQVYYNGSDYLPVGRVTNVTFGPKGSYMVTVDKRDPTDVDAEINLKFWHHDGKQFHLNTVARDAHTKPITGLACHPMLPLVATCSLDGKFKVWERIEQAASAGSKQRTSRQIWVCRSVGDFKDLEAKALSFSHDGSLLAVAYKETITLWDPMASTFQRSLTFTNCVKEDIKHLAFVPSSRYLISATDNQLLVWDLLRSSVVWSYTLEVKQVVVDTSVNYKSNLVFPSPASLVSSFLVTDGKHIFLFKPSCPKPLNVWKVEKRQVISLSFTSTSSLMPEGRIVYLNNKSELVYLEKKYDVKKSGKENKEKVSLSMSKVSNAKQEKMSAFESAFGKLAILDGKAQAKEAPLKAEDVGIPVPREDTGTIFNPTAPQMSHLFNGPSHLLPSPVKIYSSFMDGLLKKSHTHVATDAIPLADRQSSTSAANNESTMQLDESTSASTAPLVESSEDSTSKNQQKRHNKITEKSFYDSMFKFFSSYAARDEMEMPATLLNELTAPVKPSRSKVEKNQESPTTENERKNRSMPKKSNKTTTTVQVNDEQHAKPGPQQEKKKKKTKKNPEQTPNKTRKQQSRGETRNEEKSDTMAIEDEDEDASATVQPKDSSVQSNGATNSKRRGRRRKSAGKKETTGDE